MVNLTEATPPTFVRPVIDSGGWFLEMSAMPRYLNGIVDALQGTGPGTAILCVGAPPGLTNVLAAEIGAQAPDTVHIDNCVEIGMGRHYGFAATESFLRTAGQPYPVVIDHALRKVAPGQLKRKFAFWEGGPLRHSIGYGSAEQTLIAAGSDGLFHADPHPDPGNIVFHPDGRFTLLDFEMYGQLTATQQDRFILYWMDVVQRQTRRAFHHFCV